MNMRKLIGTASCSLMALSILVQPALAQAPNPGPGWVLVKQRTVRTFAANPDKPGSGAWQLVGVNNRTYFIEDSKIGRTVANSRKETQEVSLGQSAKLYDDETVLKRQKGEQLLGDVPNSKSTYFDRDFLISYKLTRYSLFEDVSGYKAWSIYNLAATKTRDINYYLIQWKDPITSETLNEVDPTPEYTAWVQGDPFNKSIASSGKDNFARRESLGTEDRRVILAKVYSPQISLADVANKPAPAQSSTFLSNQGTGNSKVALTGTKLRAALAANDAVVSKAKQAGGNGGSISDEATRAAEAKKAEEAAKKAAEAAKKAEQERAEAAKKAEQEAAEAAKKAQEAAAEAAKKADAASQEAAKKAAEAAQKASQQAAAAKVAVNDPISALVGTWRLSGGSESYVGITRDGNSDNIKVHFSLKSAFGTFEHDWNGKYQPSLSVSKLGVTTSVQVSSDGKKMVVSTKFPRHTVSSTFYKQ